MVASISGGAEALKAMNGAVVKALKKLRTSLDISAKCYSIISKLST